MVSPSRPVQAAAEVDHYPARQVDRLVLHQSSPDHSLSSPEHSGRDAGPRPKAEGLSASLGLQRPETSRGRLARAPNAPHRELESPTREELSWKTRRTLSGEGKRDEEEEEEEEEEIGKLRKKEEQEDERRKMEEEERDEEEKGRERRNEERAMERRNLDREVEEERRRCSLEKERRLRLHQEELRKEEEEEQRRLKKDSEERVR